MIHSSINFIILIFMFIPFLLIISILVFDIMVMSIMYHCCNIYWNQNHFCLQIMSIMYHCCNIYWNQNHFCLQIRCWFCKPAVRSACKLPPPPTPHPATWYITIFAWRIKSRFEKNKSRWVLLLQAQLQSKAVHLLISHQVLSVTIHILWLQAMASATVFSSYCLFTWFY